MGIPLDTLTCLRHGPDHLRRIKEHRIWPKLVIDWDKAGLHAVPVSKWTIVREGSKGLK